MKTTILIAAGVAGVIAINVVAFRSKLAKVQTVDIPASQLKAPEAKSSALRIVISGKGAYTINGESIDIAELKKRLADGKAQGMDSVSVTTASQDSFEDMETIIDLVRKTGFSRIDIETHYRK